MVFDFLKYFWAMHRWFVCTQMTPNHNFKKPKAIIFKLCLTLKCSTFKQLETEVAITGSWVTENQFHDQRRLKLHSCFGLVKGNWNCFLFRIHPSIFSFFPLAESCFRNPKQFRIAKTHWGCWVKYKNGWVNTSKQPILPYGDHR